MHLRFSKDLESLLQRLAEQPLTLKDILDVTEERGFSLVIALLVLPFLLPVPPGLTGIPGTACLILALQMAVGRRSPWLPRRVAEFRLPTWLIASLLVNFRRVTGVLEKITRPRLRRIADSQYAWHLNGICLSWLTILFILPIPLTNFVFAGGILLLAVATLEADGFLMCLCYGVTLVVTLGGIGLAYAAWQTPALLHQWFQR